MGSVTARRREPMRGHRKTEAMGLAEGSDPSTKEVSKENNWDGYLDKEKKTFEEKHHVRGIHVNLPTKTLQRVFLEEFKIVAFKDSTQR